MDADAAAALHGYVATVVARMPPGPLPRLLPVEFAPGDSARLVAEGFVRARALLAARESAERAQRVLAQLGAAAAAADSDAALDPQAMALITRTLRERPELVHKISLGAEHIRMYARNCWSVLVALVEIAESPQAANRIIQCAIARPMSVVEHNRLAQLLIDAAPTVTAETLFAYLDAVEASCRAQPAAGGAQVHNVRLAAKVLNGALDANAALAETMSIELSSFCLSYAAVKDAADLYRRVLSDHGGGGAHA
ncbi:hypothetical protein IWQ57_001433 [Coemansia nantahalensis]|uniref:Uncharacterized protein n=2 Tax=Coemansia TaxID=4863 RepID=A0ACC1LGU9_9FUNG|nr:hypothetical protein IWQ57_001433 [Coemansia nantahalensis]KAJ2807454.1 hypothetical protein H4R21_000466 [Coemansia helicoidea]